MIQGTIRQRTGHWQWIAALLCISLMLPPVAAHAGIEEIRVIGMGVDASAYAAEGKAVDYAKVRAVYMAASKLGVPDVNKVVGRLSKEQYAAIVRGAEVVQTKRVGETTYSEVNVTIVDEQLRRALRVAEAPPPDADMKVRGVLLIPVYAPHEQSYLWEKENQFRAPLWDEVRRQSHAGIMLPGGDYEDLRLIDHVNALTVTTEELKPMFERYGAEEIVIAVMTPGTTGTMDATSVLLRRLNVAGDMHNELLSIPPETVSESATTRLNKTATAVASAVTQIATSTTDREQMVRDKAKKLSIHFLYAIPKDLSRMVDAVRASPEVLSLEMPTIALAQVNATIYLKGDEKLLHDELTKQGLIVATTTDGWRMSVR